MPLKINNKETINNKKITKKEKKKLGGNMKNVSKLLTVGVGVMLTYTASALGTDAGTSISNQASVGYSVGGVAQTAVNSNSDAFLVDRKVLFTVTSSGNENVVPGETGQVLAFTVNHTGNYTGDFSLVGTNDTGDDINPSSYVVRVESGATAGYQAVEDTGTYIDELAEDGTATVYIVSTIPGTAVDGDVAKMHLEATAGAGGAAATEGAALADNSGAADVAGTVQNVFADAAGTATGDTANDGTHSDDGDYNVVAANITVTKSSTVISDGVSGSNFKRIPGAVIEYTISIANTGAAAADSLSITDTIAATMAYNAGTLIVDGVAEDDDAAGADETDPNGANYAAGVVTASIGTVAAAATKTVVFRVTVQ